MKTTGFLFLLLIITYSFAKKPDNNTPLQNANGLYKFTGKLDDKTPVFMWFVVKDSVLTGQVTYLKTTKKRPLTIAGTINTYGVTIYEFTKTADIICTYHGRFDRDRLTGARLVTGSDKELSYTLMPKDTLLTHVDTELKRVSVNGEYSYQFGEKGATGSVDIKQIDPGNFLIDIVCVNGTPEHNIADVESLKVPMVNNALIFTTSGPDSDCKFKIRAFNDFVVIDQIAGSGFCGFGLDATIKGVFMKTSKTPKFR